MLPAGKLPLHFLFLTGFVVGLFAVYFGRGILLNRAGMLDEDTLYRMKYMTVDSSMNSLSHIPIFSPRSEEHTSELQSLRHLVCRLLLEKIWCLFSWQRLIWDGFSAEESP